MEQKKKKAAFWLKGLLWMFVLMLVFTIASKTADSLTVAKVHTAVPTAKKLQYTVSAEGRIEKNREISVLTQPDILVKSVLVREGQHVEKGDLLAKLDMQDIREQIESIQDEKKILELQNDEIEKNHSYDLEKRQSEIARAEDDYQQIIKMYKEAVKKAKDELQKAKDDLKKQKKEEGSLAEQKALLQEKEKALQEVYKTKEAEEKAAKRAVQDAAMHPVADNSMAINMVTIGKLEKELRKLYALEKKKGCIRASKTGVVTSVLKGVGQKTAEEAIFTITDESAGVRFVGQMAREDARYVSVGDVVTLHTIHKDFDDISLTSMDMDEGGTYINITAMLPAKDCSIGEMVTMQAVQESKNYPCTLPIGAIHQESGKYFVYVVQTGESVLGEVYVARKMEVTILESNGIYAAIEEGAIDTDSRIIIDADRSFVAGDRVRLREE